MPRKMWLNWWSPANSISEGILGLEWCGRVLVVEFSISEKILDKNWGGGTFAYAEIVLNIKACRS